ncbi:MAG: hypothetical protein Q8Q39_05160 [bacterium]|nr:hypothetical protein [bacterium]
MTPLFSYAQSSTSSFDISVTITGTAPTPTPTPTPSATPSSGGGGTVLPPAGETTVVLQGKAYSKAIITVLRNGSVASALGARDDGTFEARISAVQGGVYMFGVFAEDQRGRKSLTLSFMINVITGMTTTISGIFIPPTIVANREIFFPDEMLELDGYAFPAGEVNVVLNSSHEIVERVPTDGDGLWNLAFSVERLGLGDHASRAMVRASDGDQSAFSETRLFRIVPRGQTPGEVPAPSPSPRACRGADLNYDGKVNLTDFSVMLFWWQARNPLHPCVDINKDGIVNLRDFSMMMYQWAI